MNRETLSHKLNNTIQDWANDLLKLDVHSDLIVLNFGLQKVFDSYEIYLTGHSWFDSHDLWILDVAWKPKNNYIELGRESLQFDRLELLKLYHDIISKEVNRQENVFNKFQRIFVGLVDSDLIRII